MELAVPDPRVAPIPFGWFESEAMPVIESADSWDELDYLESEIRTVVTFIESMDGDKTELLKAWRFVEARRGLMLGPAIAGRPAKRTTRGTFDVTPNTAVRFRKIAAHWDDLLKPHVLAETEWRRLTQTHLLALVREHTPALPDPSVSDITSNEVSLLHGDFRERLTGLPDGSVDLIVTDPPYPKEDLPLWSDLGELAVRVLGSRGLLLAWSGQMFLPEVLRRLEGAGLTYGWTFCLDMPSGGQSRVMGRHVIQAWKPILAFSVGTWPSGEWGKDTFTSVGRDKSLYEWQQDVTPAVDVIERYAPPDGLVLDPFLGVGSFGEAAVTAGRRFIGVELDAGRFRKASERLS